MNVEFVVVASSWIAIQSQSLRNAKMSVTTTMTVREPITAENMLRLFGDQVNTTVIGQRRSEAGDAELAGYDEEQIRLMEEVCIVLDENDQPIGSASKKTCVHIYTANFTDWARDS